MGEFIRKNLDDVSISFLSCIKSRVFGWRGSVWLISFFSLLLACSYAARYWMEGASPVECIYYVASYAAVSFVFFSLLLHLVLGCQVDSSQRRSFPRKLFLVVALILIAGFTVNLLMNFPGCCTPDSSQSMKMVLGWQDWSSWAPVLYTLTVAPFVLIGQFGFSDLGVGIALYSFVQLSAVAFVCSYGCCWLKSRGVPDLAVGASVAFFALNPIIARYAVTMWKDIPFSLCMFLFVLFLLDIVLSEGRVLKARSGIVRLVVLSFLVSLYRNNGLYAVSITLIVLVWVYRSTLLRRLAPVAICVPFLVLVINGPLVGAFGVAPSPFQESVGIPLQQLARTVVDGGTLTQEESETLGELMPLDSMAEAYWPTTSDGVKFNEDFDAEWLDENKGEFIKLWYQVGLKNPVSYVKAWMAETDGYWNIDTSGWAIAQSGYFGEPGVNLLEDAIGLGLFSVDRNDDFEELRLSHSFLYPVFNIACWVWLVLFLVLRCFVTRDRGAVLPYVPCVVLWLTMLVAAPEHAQFRYMFALHLLIPILIASAFMGGRERSLTSRGVSLISAGSRSDFR